MNNGRKHILTFNGTSCSHWPCWIHISDGTHKQTDYEGGAKMTNQLHKGKVAQELLERINELTKICNSAETALVIKNLAEARQILLNS